MQRPPEVLSLCPMNPLATWKIWILTVCLLSPVGQASEFDGVDGPNVRYMRHEDGSRAVFIRSPDNRRLTKKTFSANGVLTMLTAYTMDASGNPRGCKIMDGKDNELFKVAYGYHRHTGLLVEELMFDSRVRHTDENGKEVPVQRLCYIYDAEGKRSAPIVYNYRSGKTFEQVFGLKSSALEVNPFNETAPPAQR